MSMVNVQNLGFGGSGIPDALPKAVAELQNLKLAIVDGAAANTVVPVTGMDPEDRIGAALDMTALASINVSTLTVAGRNASATITCLTTAVDGDKVTVNGKAYTFKNVAVHPSYNPPPGVVPITITAGVSVPNQMAERLAKAIMSGDSTLTSSYNAAVVTVKVRQPGTAGNAYTLTETGTAANVSGATFTGGLAASGGGFSSSVSLAGKKILILWYDKGAGAATAPLMVEEDEEDEGPSALKKMVFRGGGKKEDDDEGRRDKDDGRKDDKPDGKPGPGAPKTGR